MPQNRTRGYGRSNQSHSSRRPRYGTGRPARSKGPQKAYIDPAKFVQAAKPRTAEVFTPTHQFTDFALDDRLQRNLAAMGFRTPSPIQDQTIPLGLAGRDIVGIANTGTGKTAAFALPMLQKLIEHPQASVIILAPTRELAQQINQQCLALSKGCHIRSAVLIGGAAMGPQLRDLRNRPRLIIGTPGRIKDHIERRSLNLSRVSMVVLDEVDRMLDMGFVHDIRSILENIHQVEQSFYFSATLDERVKGIIHTLSKDPEIVSVKSGDTSENIEQNVVEYAGTDKKIDHLHDILQNDATVKAIIFDDTQRSVERLSKELAARGFSADAIHGGKSQSQRQRVLNKFKASEINVLVATDVAARGLDVSDITHVINYSLPQSYDDYVHRIGRAGRAGKIGYALTFVEQPTRQPSYR